MSTFYTFNTALDEDGIQIGSEGIVPFLSTLPMIISMTWLGRWLELRAVNVHDI